jgi:hypothetical protein
MERNILLTISVSVWQVIISIILLIFVCMVVLTIEIPQFVSYLVQNVNERITRLVTAIQNWITF